jgi:hypothetical protein
MDYINVLHEQSAVGLALNIEVGAVTTRFHRVNYTETECSVI